MQNKNQRLKAVKTDISKRKERTEATKKNRECKELIQVIDITIDEKRFTLCGKKCTLSIKQDLTEKHTAERETTRKKERIGDCY